MPIGAARQLSDGGPRRGVEPAEHGRCQGALLAPWIHLSSVMVSVEPRTRLSIPPSTAPTRAPTQSVTAKPTLMPSYMRTSVPVMVGSVGPTTVPNLNQRKRMPPCHRSRSPAARDSDRRNRPRSPLQRRRAARLRTLAPHTPIERPNAPLLARAAQHAWQHRVRQSVLRGPRQ